MKLMLVICVFLVLSGLSSGQAGNDPESVIGRMVDTGSLEGHDQKVIGGMGDAGAVLLTNVLAGKDLTSGTIDNSLVVIDAVFADPSLVEPAGDRQPRTALLLLRYFDLSTNDVALKKRIVDATKYVQDRYAASLRNSRSVTHD